MKKVSKNNSRLHRKKRIRAKINGTKECPRICVFKSLTKVQVQVIDDIIGKTILMSDTKKVKGKNDMAGAMLLGTEIGKTCLKSGIKKAVFDRGGYKFHGKVKVLADSIREAGLKI